MTNQITQATQAVKIFMSHSDLVAYLKECEENPGFIPWDDQYHAAQNLVTLFGVSHAEAMCAVIVARVDVKAEHEPDMEEVDEQRDIMSQYDDAGGRQ